MNMITVVLFMLSVYAIDCEFQSSSCSKVGNSHKFSLEDTFSTNTPQCNTEDEQSNVCEKPSSQSHRPIVPPNVPSDHLRCLAREVPYSVDLDLTEERDRLEFNKIVKRELSDTGYMDNYDLRTKNAICPSITEISNQGCCDSCWAVATTDVLTDRLCLQSNGTNTGRYSVMDLMSCCHYCLMTDITKPCEKGGKHELGWVYWKYEGIVSGHYNGKGRIGCRNYHVNPYEHHGPKNVGKEIAGTGECLVSTMSCPLVKYGVEPNCDPRKQECDGDWTGRSYTEDRMKGKECYYMIRKFDDVEAEIKLEILRNGPMHAFMTVYEDFYTMFTNNQSFEEVEPYGHPFGYKNVTKCSGHSIRIVGWGKNKNNKSYWIAANSWGEEWGNDGFFPLALNHDKGPNKGKERFYAGIPILELV